MINYEFDEQNEQKLRQALNNLEQINNFFKSEAGTYLLQMYIDIKSRKIDDILNEEDLNKIVRLQSEVKAMCEFESFINMEDLIEQIKSRIDNYNNNSIY